MESLNKVIYIVYNIKPDEQLLRLKPSNDDLKNELVAFISKDYKIQNLIFPTQTGDVFITIDSKDEKDFPKQFKNALYELNRQPTIQTKIPNLHFTLSSDQLKRLCNGIVKSCWDILIKNLALYVNEYHDAESNVAYFINGDLFQFELINYILEKTANKAPNTKNNDDTKVKKVESNLVVDEKPIEPTQEDYQIKFMKNEKNELIYEKDSIKIHLKEGNLFDEPTDILVAPANCDLKLIGPFGAELFRRGGRTIENQCNSISSKGKLLDGEIAATTAGDMRNAKFIFHVVSPNSNTRDQKQLLKIFEKMFLDIFMLTTKYKNASTIALPLVGTGFSNIPLYLCISALYDAIEKYIKSVDKSNKILKHIKIVNIKPDVNVDTIKFFNAKLKSVNENPPRTSTITTEKRDNQEKNYSIQVITNTVDEFSFSFQDTGLRVNIVKGDIINHPASVIVNSANNALQLSSGLGKVILSKAGNEIQVACDSYLKKKQLHFVRDGEVLITKAFELKNFDWVFHGVGPKKENPQCNHILELLFLEIFLMCEHNKFNSIALPLISSGSHGVAKDSCCKALFSAIERTYLNGSKTKKYLECIKIVSIESETNSEIVKNFLSKLNNIEALKIKAVQAPKVEQQKESTLNNENQIESNKYPIQIISNSLNEFQFSFKDADLRVEIRKGDLFDEVASVMVYSAINNLQLTTEIGKRIVSKAGNEIQKECNDYLLEKIVNQIEDGKFVSTTAHGMKSFDYIFHAVTPKMNKNEDLKKYGEILENLFMRIFLKCELFKVNSIVLPLLDTETVEVPPNISSKALFSAIEKLFLKINNKTEKFLKCIKIVNIESRKNYDVMKHFQSNLNVSTKEENRETPTDELQYKESTIDLTVQFFKGNIVDQKADAMVHVTSEKFSFKSPNSQALLDKAGSEIEKDCERKNLEGMNIIVTKAFKMENYKHVFHIALPDVSIYSSDIKLYYREMDKGFQSVFSIIEANNIESISLPLVYSDIYNVPPAICYNLIASSLQKYIQSTLKRKLKLIRMEYLKAPEYHEFIRSINMSYKFIPSNPSVYKQQISFDYQRSTKYDDDDDDETNRYSSLPTSLTKSKISPEKEIKEDIDTYQVDESQLRFIFKSVNLKVEIFQGDLLDTKADVIVNAANNRLQLGGGVAGAIRSKTGYKVQDECDIYASNFYQRQLSDGSVMHTKSYLNNCDNIIHAVGPSIDNYYRNEKLCYEKLFETFLNVLVYAEEKLKVKSIALPLISSGIFGVPKDVCSEMLYKGLQEFIVKTKNKTNRNLICIKIVSIDSPTNDEILKVFKRKLNILKKTENVKEKVKEEIVIEAEVKTEIKEEEKEKHGKCSVCDKEIKLKISLECGCNYCHLCKDNYYQNDNKCFCPEKEEN